MVAAIVRTTGQAVGMMATSLAERCHGTGGHAECVRQLNYEKKVVGRTAMNETRATEPCVIAYVSAATGRRREDDRAEGDVEHEDCEGWSNGDESESPHQTLPVRCLSRFPRRCTGRCFTVSMSNL